MNSKILALAAATLFAGVAMAQPPGGSSVKSTSSAGEAVPHSPDLPEGPGRVVVQTACGQCHGMEVITNQSRSRQDWSDVVSRMIGNGAQLSDEEYNLVIAYLAKNYGSPAPGGAPSVQH